MPPEVADRMRTLATLTERVEPTDFDVADVDVATGEGEACGSVLIEGDLLDVPESHSVTVTDARIDGNGGLELDLEVDTDGQDGGSGEGQAASADDAAEGPEDPTTTTEATGEGDDTATADDPGPDTATDDADPETTASDGPDPADETTDGSGDDAADSDRDTPAYRDPEELAAVYDSEATFAEMTEALDVDVTAQTVRKYVS